MGRALSYLDDAEVLLEDGELLQLGHLALLAARGDDDGGAMSQLGDCVRRHSGRLRLRVLTYLVGFSPCLEAGMGFSAAGAYSFCSSSFTTCFIGALIGPPGFLAFLSDIVSLAMAHCFRENCGRSFLPGCVDQWLSDECERALLRSHAGASVAQTVTLTNPILSITPSRPYFQVLA